MLITESHLHTQSLSLCYPRSINIDVPQPWTGWRSYRKRTDGFLNVFVSFIYIFMVFFLLLRLFISQRSDLGRSTVNIMQSNPHSYPHSSNSFPPAMVHFTPPFGMRIWPVMTMWHVVRKRIQRGLDIPHSICCLILCEQQILPTHCGSLSLFQACLNQAVRSINIKASEWLNAITLTGWLNHKHYVCERCLYLYMVHNKETVSDHFCLFCS